MGYVKVVKNKAYFKRFQVKFRRRREGRTDYQARKNLIRQELNRYNTPKYRAVVRFTNTDIITQIIYSTLKGDRVLAAAYAHELKQDRYGLKVGLTNYSAAYCTGLLLARRLLKKLNLDTKYPGAEKTDGEVFLYTKPSTRERKRAKRDGKPVDKSMRPFRALLDVGLKRTTTGAKVFAALKGAVDGGLSIPHSPSRFAGYSEGKLDAAALRARIFGTPVANYMRSLESNAAAYKKQFSKYQAAGVGPGDLEALYAKVHANIRKTPEFQSQAKKAPAKHKNYGHKRLSYAQRKDRVRQRIESFRHKTEEALKQEEDDE